MGSNLSNIMMKNEFWPSLSSENRWFLDSRSLQINLKRGDKVYTQGDAPQGIYFIESGLVGLTKSTPGGKEHLLRLFRNGQYFGHRSLFTNENYHGTAITLEQTKLKLIPRDVFLSLVNEHPNVLLDLVKVLAIELRRCEDNHVMILDNQINARVAQSLVYLKDLHPEHNWTRQEIANFCASTVSTVIKSLSELENMALISQEGRSIKILKRDALISMQD